MFMMDQLYEKKVVCLLCSNAYQTKKVLSRSVRVDQAESDFYTTYHGPNPNYYLVHVCPACGFSFMEKTTPKITSYKKNRYMEEVASRWVPRDYGHGRSVQEALVATKLAIFCAQHVEEPARTVGGLCLQVAWFYRELGNEPEEQRFLREAVDFYTYAYETDSSIEDDGRLPYLIGELHRRLGERKEAVDFFNRVVRDKNALAKYVRMARDQWAIVSEENKQQMSS
jgi:uncharacterized protein